MRTGYPLLLFLILCPLLSVCQQSAALQHFYYGITAGANYSKLTMDGSERDFSTRPQLGIFGKAFLTNHLGLKSSVSFSLKGSVADDPHRIVENAYIDLDLLPQWKVCDGLYVQAGGIYSHLLYSNAIINDSHRSSGTRKTRTGGFDSEFNGLAGLEIKLQRLGSFEANYVIPVKKGNTGSLQLLLHVLLNSHEPAKGSYAALQRRTAREQIIQMKEGTLLVRLRTGRVQTDALEKSGKHGKAEHLKQELSRENQKLVAAFRKHFDFCKVVFFTDDHLMDIVAHHYDGIFVNDELMPDPSVKIETGKLVFIAEIGTLTPDTMKFYDHDVIMQDMNGKLKKFRRYYCSSTQTDFFALLIRDQNLVQLQTPFPYYTRAIYKTMKKSPEEGLFITPAYLLFMTWTYERTVGRMNYKLKRYYRSVMHRR